MPLKRVRPQDVAHEALVWRLAQAIDGADVVQSDAVLAEQAAVDDENLEQESWRERESGEKKKKSTKWMGG